jgi:hypothetical protein
MTIFSDKEEAVFEGSLGGDKLRYYPAKAMAQAGGSMQFVAPWQPGVVIDRELITGQNPLLRPRPGERLHRGAGQTARGRLTPGEAQVPLDQCRQPPWAAFHAPALARNAFMAGVTLCFRVMKAMVPALASLRGGRAV